MQQGHKALVESVRGSIVECVFRGSAAVVDLRGALRFSIGNPYAVTTIRSTAKPLQAIPLLDHPQIDSLALTAEEIAIIVGSHNGERRHEDVVEALMQKQHLSVGDLQCGTHPPFFFTITEEVLLSQRRRLSPVQHNCSGNHVGIILLARLMGQEISTYPRAEHPAEQAITKAVCEMLGILPSEVLLSTDGCGIPTYAARLDQLAFAFARLASHSEDQLHGRAVSRIRSAMMAHPFLVAGTDRLETDLMTLCPVVAKIGSQGVYAIGIPKEQLGVAIKIEAGSGDAAESAAVEVLRLLGLLSADALQRLARYRLRPILATTGAVVGHFRPVANLNLKPASD